MALRVHFHTDNHAYSGSEVVLTSLLRWACADPGVAASLTYRSSPAYDRALEGRLPQDLDAVPLRLPDPTDLASPWRHRPLVWRVARGLLEVAAMTKLLFAIDVVRLGRRFRRSRPDVVHVNNGGFPGAISCNAAVVAARWAGVPVVTYVVNNLASPRRGLRRWSDWPIDQVVARRVTRFVTGSAAAGRALREVLGLTEDRVSVIPNGVEIGSPRQAGPAPLPPLPVGAAVVVVVARLEQRKGHRVLFEALARLLRERGGPPPVVLLAGDGPERAALEGEVARLGLGEVVHLLGQRHDVPELLRRCDVVVLPSIGQEDSPLVVLEAMAAGRPLVATRVAGIPEQVVHGETGLLVAPGDVGELVAALGALIDDPRRRAVLGEAGRARFQEHFGAGTAVERYRQLFRHLAQVDPR